MAENKDGMEKSEEATSKKQEDSRKDGNVARSIDLSSGVLIIASAAVLYYYVPYVIKNFEDLMRDMLNFGRVTIDKETTIYIFFYILKFTGKMLIPIFAALFIVAAAITIFQVGFHITGKAIEPKFDKLNFFTNFIKTFFNKRKVVDLIKSVFKIFVLSAYAWYLVAGEMDIIVRMSDADYRDQMAYLGKLIFEIIFKLGIIVLIMGIADYIYQKWQHNQDIKMTKQEVKEEYKQMEGDPIVKNRIRQAQREAARQRMMEEVPKSDVVITNPTHFAVAIRYDLNADKAPKVVAKGQRLMALRIRELAIKSGVKVYQDPPLARTLFNSVDIDEEIPENLYKALAQILMSLDKFKNFGK